MAVDDSYTKSLLHCDGADTSTTITDESGKTWTAVANAQIDTTAKKFGTGSVIFDGEGDIITCPTSADWDVGSGDFTVDFWLYPTTAARQGVFYLSYDTHYHFGIDFHYSGTRNINIWASSNGSSWDLLTADAAGNGTGGTSLALTTWSHVAVTRSGNVWRTFINGVKDIEQTAAGTVLDSNETIMFGNWKIGALSYFSGQLDEFRFSLGIARWTANFTAPTSSYPLPTTNYLKQYRRNRIPGLITGL